MSKYERELAPSDNRFLTGHTVFDEIVKLNYGSSILMLDETFSEAHRLLHILFKNYGAKSIGLHYDVAPHAAPSIDEHILSVGDQSLSDISIAVNDLRRKYPGIPIIHMALPEMIIKNEPEAVLRLLTAWQKNIREADTVEFYILPRGTFQDVEQKILSLVNGCIEIKVEHTEGRFRSYLKPIRCCSSENHLKEFQYTIDDGRLLIRWGEQLADELIPFDQEEIKRRVEDYKENIRFLKVIHGGKTDTQSSVYDYWMISQIKGKLLSEINELFPEDFDQLLQKIASWQISDVLRVVRETEPSKRTTIKKYHVSRSTRLTLILPIWLTTKLIRLRLGKPRVISLDVALTNRRATMAFIDMLFTKLELKETDYMDRLLEMQKRFNEISARETAAKHIKRLGEDSSLKLDERNLPKILELTFRTAYRITPHVVKVAEGAYEIEVDNCFECGGITSNRPICSSIEGVIEGIGGVVFKKRTRCHETGCKALGDAACMFKVEID